MARHMWDARCAGQAYANLPDALAPASIDEAYAAQEAYWRLAEPVYGPVAGVKVATTTKVMQQLMGINHPCGAAIFANTIHPTPARIAKAGFVNLRVESEIALKLGADMPATQAPWTANSAARCVAGAMAAYELIEDRNAVYTETKAASMIADNCWNGGVVLGPMKAVTARDVAGVRGTQTINGKLSGEGHAEDPFATLAWLANLLAQRQRGLTSGMVVITGSLIPTFSVTPGDRVVFAVDGLGEVAMDVV
ncbi:MAG: fumarylacetoacetate hydrolase family protein [Ramlibacter sp.]|nr:fumarylacetoacetate hydrolase family protein [Ramlibacter sp.]